MKKYGFTICLVAFYAFGSLTLTSCGAEVHEHSEDTHEHSEDTHEHEDSGDEQLASVYSCPMQCEGDKTYDAEGSCPECGMDLEEISGGDDDHDHDHEHDHDDGHDHDEDHDHEEGHNHDEDEHEGEE